MDGLSSRGVGFGVGPGGSCPTYDYEIEHSKVETWLDEHPEFFKVGILNIIFVLRVCHQLELDGFDQLLTFALSTI